MIAITTRTAGLTSDKSIELKPAVLVAAAVKSPFTIRAIGLRYARTGEFQSRMRNNIH